MILGAGEGLKVTRQHLFIGQEAIEKRAQTDLFGQLFLSYESIFIPVRSFKAAPEPLGSGFALSSVEMRHRRLCLTRKRHERRIVYGSGRTSFGVSFPSRFLSSALSAAAAFRISLRRFRRHDRRRELEHGMQPHEY